MNCLRVVVKDGGATLTNICRSEAFSGQALVYLLLNRLADLPNASFSLVEIPFSAQDLITLFTKLHDGRAPAIVRYTEEEYQTDLKKDILAAMGAASKKGLAVGVAWPGEVVSTFPGWQQKTLEDYVKPSMTAETMTFENMRAGTDLSKD